MTQRTFGLLVLLLAMLAGGVRADSLDYAALRQEMVHEVRMEARLTGAATGASDLDSRVLAVLAEVPRHEFLPEQLRPFAYGSHPLPLGHGQNLAAPFLVALMTHLAAPQPDDVVFETGTGAGYHAAVLSRLAARVYSLEIVGPLADAAAANLKRLGYDNVYIKQGDGYYGWSAHAPYDAIIVKESVDHVPSPLLQQLKPGGRMVIPLGPANGAQFLTVVEKGWEGRIRKTRVLPVRFSPFQGGERT